MTGSKHFEGQRDYLPDLTAVLLQLAASLKLPTPLSIIMYCTDDISSTLYPANPQKAHGPDILRGRVQAVFLAAQWAS